MTFQKELLDAAFSLLAFGGIYFQMELILKTQFETSNSFAEKTRKKFIILHTQGWNPCRLLYTATEIPIYVILFWE
jgi:hypothetical protein